MPLRRLPRPTELLAAFAAGVLLVAAFAPLAWYPLAPLALAVLYLLGLHQPGTRAAAAIGFAFGLGCFLGGVSWVYVSLSVFGGMVAWLAALSTLVFCMVLALFPALAVAVFARLSTAGLRVPLFSAAWVLGEWLRGTLFTGFPWLAVGYSQGGDSPLAGLAPLFGTYGVSFVTALIAACLGEAVWRWRSGYCPASGHPRWAYAAVPLLIAALLGAGGAVLGILEWTHPAGRPVRVALLQGNIAQDMKWRPESFQTSLRTYDALFDAHPADLTVLPETALPAFWEALPPAFVESLREQARARGGDVLIGAVAGTGERYTNSVFSVGTAPTQRYDKVHLVPFGEFVPPGFATLMRQLSIPMSGFSAGRADQPPLRVGGTTVAVNICYEDVFGDALRPGARAAAILVNVSNTAWFGRSLAQPQHLQIARMRARETGRPMLRATNTGMTAIVEPDGRVSAVLEPFVRGALVADVQGRTGETPYLRWGDRPVLIASLLLLAVALIVGRARRLGRAAD
ncbi:MAG TPA: apolipoprotein N-acyltransferase [Rhodocyclaceae bacterium]